MHHEDSNGKKILPAEKGRPPRFSRLSFFAAVASICFFLSSGSVANAQTCGTPVLTGMFALDPCDLPDPTTVPGQTFQQYLQGWWSGQFMPALMSMTAQLYSYRIWETAILGHLTDAQDINRAMRTEQEQRVTAQQGALPDDQICILGTAPLAQTRTTLIAAALTQGFKQDLLRRAHNAVQNPVNGSYTPPGRTPAFDVKARWAIFCKEFYDPNSNDGKGICGDTPGPAMNDDIGVEGFLFRDTIDLNNPHLYNAAEAFLINIVQPQIHENLPPTILTSPQGHEYTLRLQHLEALRNIAADVVGSIISRRAPLSSTDKTLATQVSNIRKQAAIPACPASPQPSSGICYSTNPSYNEIMLALTKERFFAPSYFLHMENNPGTIKQEQAAIDGYTTVQLQDIYKLQEQINALLAARAALKLSTDQVGSQTPSAPN